MKARNKLYIYLDQINTLNVVAMTEYVFLFENIPILRLLYVEMLLIIYSIVIEHHTLLDLENVISYASSMYLQTSIALNPLF